MKKLHRGTIAAAAAVIAVGLTLAGCSNSSSLSGGGSSSKGSIIVGSAGFPENVALAYVYGGALAADGVKVSYHVNIGERTAYIPALQKGEINLIPEYAGSILNYFNKTATQKSGSDVKAALESALPKGLAISNFAEATDADSITVLPDFAKANDLSSIGDLAKLPSVNIGAAPQFQTRTDGIPALQSVYGLNNITFTPFKVASTDILLGALKANTIQAADIFTTDPAITDDNLVVLKDPKNQFASQQVVPLGTSKKLTSAVKADLDKVSAKLTTDDLIAFNKRISGDEKADPKTVANDWLKKNGFTK